MTGRGRRLTRHLARAGLVASLFTALGTVQAPIVSADSGASVPAGFSDERLIGGLTDPTAVVFAADGHVFVSQKDGMIYVYDSVADSTATVFADLRSQVNAYWDRGLLGLAVHPEFPAKPYLYALYTHDPTNRWGDSCPNPPGGLTDGCVAAARLARLTASGAGPTEVVASRAYLIDSWCTQFPSHSIGAMAWGPGPSLFVTGGEGAAFHGGDDYGQWGGKTSGTTNSVPVNPCNDPVQTSDPDGDPATPPVVDPVTSEGGSLRSQDYRTTGDPLGLAGSIIRIDPITGAGWPSNANAASSDANRRRLIGYGLRNPFRLTIRPGTAEVWIADVGGLTHEEIDRIADPTAAPRNFGWPCYEGSLAKTGFRSLGNRMCLDLAATAVQNPAFAYAHNAHVVTDDGCGTGSSSIAGITFLAKDAPMPAAYQGALFFTDYNRRCIWYAPADAAGLPDFAQRARFADLRRSGICDVPPAADGCPGASVFLTTDSVGHLVYVDYDRGEIRRIRHIAGNHPPDAEFTASATYGPLPLTVDFDASGTTDADGEALTYAWDLDADGQYDDSTSVTASRTYVTAGPIIVRLRVTDGLGATDTASRTIVRGGSPPSISSMTPSASLTWQVGDDIAFSGTATDAQDGTLPASAFVWTLQQQHCPSNCHTHTVETFSGVRSGSFPAPDHEVPSYLRLVLRVTDSTGLTATTSRDLQPELGTVSASSTIGSALLTVGDVSGTSVGPVSGIVGGTLTVAAAPTVTVGETIWAWKSWSNGGARVQAVKVTEASQALQATYAVQGTIDLPDTCTAAPMGSASSTWRSGLFGKTGDIDWYRFTMTSAGTVRIVLGDLAVGGRASLYSGCSTALQAVDRAGTGTEEIIATLAKGTYAVRVANTGGASETPYSLLVRRQSSGLSLLSSRSRTSGSTLTLLGEVWNDSTARSGPIKVTAKLYDAGGTLLSTRTGYTEMYAAGRSRVPFRIAGSLPAGFARATFTLSGPTTTKSFVTLPTAGLVSTRVDERWRVKGTVRSTVAVTSVRVAMVQYDRRGTVLDVTRASTPSTTLAAGGQMAFDAWSVLPGAVPDLVRIQTIGYRP